MIRLSIYIIICIMLTSLTIVGSMKIANPKTIDVPANALIMQDRAPDPQDVLPIVDYSPASSATSKDDTASTNVRQMRSLKYEKTVYPIREYEGDISPLPSITHWDRDVSPLPSDKSNIIVIGKILESRAFLTTDRSNVYSEFTFQLNEIIKNGNDFPIKVEDIIAITRSGGAIRFASGKVQEYRIHNQQMPAKGSTYLMFLRGDTIDNMSIITGYELREGKVHPLDTSQQFRTYAGAGVNHIDFLNAVQDSVKGGK